MIIKSTNKPPSWLTPKKRSNSKAIKVSSPEEAKMVLQSYVLTTAKYDFSVYEKRILYYCVKEAQKHLRGLKLGKHININTIIDTPAQRIRMPIAEVLVGENDKNHYQIKSALISLLDKKIVYEDHELWTAFTMIQEPKVSKTGEWAEFTVNPILWQCILDFSKGFHPYELQAAMKFTSVYSMRFYEFVSNSQRGFEPEVPIATIRGWFGLENKYTNNAMLIERVVKAAQKDLDKCAPWSFDFEPIKEGRKITRIKIKPRECPQNGDQRLQEKVIERRTNISWDIPDRDVRHYLMDTIGFTTTELKNNRELWKNAYILLGDRLYDVIQDKYEAARKLEYSSLLHTSVKGYVVGAVKKVVESITEEQSNPLKKYIDDIAEDLSINS